jgi:vancomycin permeability regulator SanA
VRVWPALVLLLLLSVVAEAAGRRALLVFGTAVNKDGTPSAKLERRLKLAAHLATEDPHAVVIVSGGANGGWSAEGPVMAAWLARHGVDVSRILIEDQAHHTGENADFSVPLIEAADVSEVTVVTERYHQRRAKVHLVGALRAAGARDVRVHVAGADDGLRGRRRLMMAISETWKIARDLYLRWRAARQQLAAGGS